MKTKKYKIFEKILYYIHQKKIVSGPFQGMFYINTSHGSAFLPKILGTYEKELHNIISEIVNKEYEIIIDIGAAEGFYVVGLAYLKKIEGHRNFLIQAFDTNLAAHPYIKELAIKNNVQNNIEVHEFCNHEVLNTLPDKNIFILCDIEGAETSLLDPQKVEKLYKIDMLVELHDGKENFALEEFTQRFRNSHNIEVIHFRGRQPEEAPWWLLHPKLKVTAVREGRKRGLKWMYLKAKH
ncbi:hypothetical protein LZ575_20605 [Antarcticibacterium sp. 1MA-6-2]|uniref:hypothetical protein n=1 Tax=Antarcticibacterium sp. 1MA-6-2 TaxID=2908210 RepID=UPI001F399956|nr:hypothetical protein [Antarcticibacterium sp. 1MA-6-2]UJH91036.1 hypothetical protein LZ575_20605 [Antarcticibacterium sp. 1MA-6-2]